MSFPVVLGAAVAATLALVGVAVFVPGYMVPSAIAIAALAVTPIVVPFLKKRAAERRGGERGRSAYGAHTPRRMQSVIEAYNTDEKPDITILVDYILQQAVLQLASDIHVVPYRDYVLVRFRVDGILTDIAKIDAKLREQVTNRLKVLSRVIIFVHDRPQDGRLDLTVGEREVDLRVAFMPTMHGERVVMRILDRGESGYGLETLGFSTEQLRLFKELVERPQGMVILNGPTGSGKTTTIYSALRDIQEHSAKGSSIYTLEDPIEFDLTNINQTQIEEAQGFTFAQGLRTMLRQDPDVIMVGEIRDLDTARIAVQAGMTGHLIITTVHAKQAAGVFVRLNEIGVDSHSVASAVTAVVGQRLVRVLCPKCKVPTPATPGQEAKLGLPLGGHTYYAPAGCAACNQKGYSGRKGVYEILLVDEAMRELVAQRASPDRIHQTAVQRGMTTLIDNGVRTAQAGDTSLEEVLRILPPEQQKA
jgi:type II secretory ATPase GspE/PulE/Tfp pilus assembly ATPase PilB-like protein